MTACTLAGLRDEVEGAGGGAGARLGRGGGAIMARRWAFGSVGKGGMRWCMGTCCGGGSGGGDGARWAGGCTGGWDGSMCTRGGDGAVPGSGWGCGSVGEGGWAGADPLLGLVSTSSAARSSDMTSPRRSRFSSSDRRSSPERGRLPSPDGADPASVATLPGLPEAVSGEGGCRDWKDCCVCEPLLGEGSPA